MCVWERENARRVVAMQSVLGPRGSDDTVADS